MSSNDGPSPFVDFIAGTVAGIASLLVGHPFDTVKTRLQTQSQAIEVCQNAAANTPLLSSASTSAAVISKRYRNASDAFRVIIKEEKVLGLYKGVMSPMLGVAVMNASVFGFYGLALRAQQGSSHSSVPPSLDQIFIAGCASGVLSAFITAPIDLIKIREQLDTSSQGARPHTREVVRQIYAQNGLRGLYRGLGSTCLRDLGYGSYFLSYEVLNRALLSLHSPSSPQLSAWEFAVSGGLAGVLAWVCTFPIDVVKTRVQASTKPLRMTSFIDTTRATWREGGFRAFWAGVGPTVLRAIPVNSVLFIVFESMKDSLTKAGL